MTTQENKQPENQQQQVEQAPPVEEQAINPSRAKFDFQGDAPPAQNADENTPKDETEQKLLQLDSEGNTETPTEEPSTDKSEQQKPEVESNSDLPDLAELDLPEDLGLEAKTKEEENKEVPPEFKKFAEDFEKYMGVSLDQFKASQQEAVNYVNQVKAEQAKVEATKLLASDWGVEASEVEGRLEKVQERFNKYPEDMRKRLDSVEGAKLIWAKIEQEENARINKQVPQFQRSRGRSNGQPKALFTQKEIENMSPEAYARNADRILRAYQMGLVQQ